MTHQLFLLRHAKSDWTQNLKDHDRPLNNRGRKAAIDMGCYLQQQQLCPDQLYCSTAERAKQTILAVLQNLDYPESQVHWDARIYGATLYELLSLLSEWLPHSNSIMMVGHNPGMEELLDFLVPTEQIDEYDHRFSTASFAQIQLPDKMPYRRGCGQLLRYVSPRELAD
ncbi:MAG: histidine phosphatase family protein [Gammaproteobacteria bacterium]|nr:histidine phosphatase family protein [Gammaproteobacteria bacterium]